MAIPQRTMSKWLRRLAQRRGAVGGVDQRRRARSAAASRDERRERGQLRGEELGVARRRWRSGSSRRRAPACGAPASTASATAERLRRVARAEAAHAGVELDVHPRPGARSRPDAAARTASTNRSLQATTSAPAASATGSSSALSAPITSNGAVDPRRRAALRPRRRSATASHVAPPASAARATAAAPCP